MMETVKRTKELVGSIANLTQILLKSWIALDTWVIECKGLSMELDSQQVEKL